MLLLLDYIEPVTRARPNQIGFSQRHARGLLLSELYRMAFAGCQRLPAYAKLDPEGAAVVRPEYLDHLIIGRGAAHGLKPLL